MSCDGTFNILLIDASNAFNAHNRKVALNNLSIPAQSFLVMSTICNFGNFGNFGKFETRSQLSSSGSARLLVTVHSKILLLLAAT